MFWKHAVIGPECWHWTGPHDRDGYSTFMHDGKNIRAHRYSAAMTHPVRPKDIVRHLCNIEWCVNPAHLAVGTQKDNIADQLKAGTHSGLHRKKWSEDQLLSVVEEYKAGVGVNNLVHKHGISRSVIYRAIREQVW